MFGLPSGALDASSYEKKITFVDFNIEFIHLSTLGVTLLINFEKVQWEIYFIMYFYIIYKVWEISIW